ncbi:Retrovirus-related Pol polyprotein from transposon TNT 1-94 [Sesamum angolense]|uniref:Retrovirus-related Pol polyprotein from transposon TNT 1-94 n=1 Tax=Sesamum angolense TaxID=2727404 RepID=A0AAE1WWI9_9LAMI|nr:Retrovirus-related Pol polyprotein from transposon TNT 1-94 [Sesamum angolense]
MKDLGATTKILGMEIHRDRGSRKLWLSQRGYVEKVLDRFGMKSKAVESANTRLNQVDTIGRQSSGFSEAVAEAAKEALWLSGLSKELCVEQGGVQLHCDSPSAIYLAKNQVCHARTKHIDVRYHKIRELIAFGEIILQKFHTSDNAVDMLTKLLTVDKFN